MSEEDGSGGQKKDDERPKRPRSITLKFEEPGALKLPDELDEPAAPPPKPRKGSEPQLRLDTGEFHPVDEPADADRKYAKAADALAEWTRSSQVPQPPVTTPSGSLDLDLDDLDPGPEAKLEDAEPTRGTVEYSPAMAKKFPMPAPKTPAAPAAVTSAATQRVATPLQTERPPPPPPAPRPRVEAPAPPVVPAPAAAPPAVSAPSTPPSDEEEELEPGPHDGWTRDRQARRSITPPPAEYRAESATAKLRAISMPVPAPLPQPADNPEALELVDRSRPSRPEVQLDLATEMVDRYALGDFTGALRAAEMLLGREPDHGEARQYAESSRERLIGLYTSRLGTLDQQVEVVVPASEVRWLGLDHRAGFLLSRMEGQTTIEEAIDVSGMQRLEALKTLVDLLDARAIRLRGPR